MSPRQKSQYGLGVIGGLAPGGGTALVVGTTVDGMATGWAIVVTTGGTEVAACVGVAIGIVVAVDDTVF